MTHTDRPTRIVTMIRKVSYPRDTSLFPNNGEGFILSHNSLILDYCYSRLSFGLFCLIILRLFTTEFISTSFTASLISVEPHHPSPDPSVFISVCCIYASEFSGALVNLLVVI